MSRTSRFKQSDLVRALKAAEKAGVKMAVEIASDGTVRLVPVTRGDNPLGHVERREGIRL